MADPPEWMQRLKPLAASAAAATCEGEFRAAMARLHSESSKDTPWAREDPVQPADVFLATIGHEIRTPMNGILGMLQLLEPTLNSPEQQEFAATLRQSANHLLAVLNDLLDLSRIRAGRMEMTAREFALREELTTLTQLYQGPCREKGLDWRPLLGPHLPTRASGPADRLWQVVHNLLGNALKFTRRGWVGLRADASPGPGGGWMLHLEVEDTGTGIAADRLDDIFEPFVQAEATTTRDHGGTGLGLAICRQLVSAMGGRIDVSSQPGVGTCFRVTVPLQASEQFVPPPTRPRLIPLRQRPLLQTSRLHRRVLLAEDHPVNRMVVSRLLQREGFEVVEVEDGLAVLEHLAGDADFDGVLMDVQMPRMDGWEATRAIRAKPSWDHLPVVGLTAHGQDLEMQRYLDAGMSDCLSKPVRAEELARVGELLFGSSHRIPWTGVSR